ncbi:MAG: tetratricopeptide repeat protein [Leptolyngbyaceae cyanobacterium SM1_3_5]|nr:tetratricopeptide repeat protein [Leptolyngbyaceae cyanobacterium SM1_3_5]
MIARANLLAAQGDAIAATQDFTQAISFNSNSADALTGRANLALAQGDPSSALADFERAIAIDPENADAYFSRGRLRAEQGNQAGAIADFNLAAELYLQAGRAAEYRQVIQAVTALRQVR